MATIGELLGRSGLIQSDTPLLDAQLLLCHVLECNRAYLYTWPDREVTPEQAEYFSTLLARRRLGEPVAYLLGYREFWSLSLQVNESTLIPRADTEMLVAQALSLTLPGNARILDLGTGTGAIALALAHERPAWQVVAVDKEYGAVELARANAASLGLGDVKIYQSDWFIQVEGHFDLIVSNPPYIDSEDPHLLQGDVRFEPRSALVAVEQGLSDIEWIVAESGRFLNAGGYLLLEHGFQQGEAVRERLECSGYCDIATVRDLAGQERVSKGRWPG